MGNQLFQLSMALWISESSESEVTLDVSALRKRVRGVSKRYLELEPHGLPFATSASILASRIRESRMEVIGDEFCPQFEDGFQEPAHACIFDGYFQNWRLVEAVRPKLERMFAHRFEAASKHDHAVAVHVRLGDYLFPGPQKTLGATDPEWSYEMGARLATESGLGRVVIFSDSPHLLPAFPEEASICFRVAEVRSAWDALIELSRYPVILLANSSFSWWAATLSTWFSRGPTCVVAPFPWRPTPSEMDTALIPPTWRIENRRMIRRI